MTKATSAHLRNACSTAICLCVALAGCGAQDATYDRPVSSWLKDTDTCVRETAQAIINSGRPYPNEVWDKSVQPNRLVRYDLWMGDQLFEMPGSWHAGLGRDSFPLHHPLRYVSIAGASVEDVLGIPKRKFKDPKVGGTIYGQFVCELGQPPSQWIEAKTELNPTVDSIQRTQREDGNRFVVYEVTNRTDINMTEIFAETRSPNRRPAGSEVASIFYLNLSGELRQTINGKEYRKLIYCNRKHDPGAALEVGSYCSTWVWVAPGIHIRFNVYQQYMPYLPAIHNRLLQDLELSRRK
ncbi:MAG: hypothetical protein ABIR26_13565 [Ramlibacter sp.]